MEICNDRYNLNRTFNAFLGANGTISNVFQAPCSAVRSAQFLYIVPCTVGLGWFAAKDMIIIGELQHVGNRRILKT
jgi:hypothetical protein